MSTRITRLSALIDVSDNATTTNEVAIGNRPIVAVEMPAAWDAASITLSVKPHGATTYSAVTVDDNSGAEKTWTGYVSAGKLLVVPPAILAGLSGFVKVVSSATQTADRQLYVHVKNL